MHYRKCLILYVGKGHIVVEVYHAVPSATLAEVGSRFLVNYALIILS